VPGRTGDKHEDRVSDSRDHCRLNSVQWLQVPRLAAAAAAA
jgi:hypothetical protein